MAKVNTPDVLVIDAGPAGYTAAILLTQRGWGVTWLEKYPPALAHQRVAAVIEHTAFAMTRGTGHRARHQRTRVRRRLSLSHTVALARVHPDLRDDHIVDTAPDRALLAATPPSAASWLRRRDATMTPLMNTAFTAALHVDYAPTSALGMLLADRCVLAVFGFGADAPRADDPRYVRVRLEPYGAAPLEVWSSNTPVDCGRNAEIAWASNGQLQFGVIELEEGAQPIESCAERLYTRLTNFVAGSSTPHLLRIWNYLDAITIGTGDHERYRKFNIGRARGLGSLRPHNCPLQQPSVTAANTASFKSIGWLQRCLGHLWKIRVRSVPTAIHVATAHNLKLRTSDAAPAPAQCHCCCLALQPSSGIAPCIPVNQWHNWRRSSQTSTHCSVKRTHSAPKYQRTLTQKRD